MLCHGRCKYILVVLFFSWLLASCSSSNSSNEENNQPVADFVVTASVNAGETAITGLVISTQPANGSTLSFEISDGSDVPAGFTLNSDGSFNFNPADSSYLHLNAGDTEVLTILITVTDAQGATEITEIKITVTGTNDAPVVVVAVSNSVEEDAAILPGQLTFIDVDDNSTVTFAVSDGASIPSGFALNSDGSYSFDPSDAAYQHLNVGDTEVLTIPVTVTDDQGATDTTQIQITVTGTNDAPVAGDDVTASVEEGTTIFTGQLTSSDVDDGATASFTVSASTTPPAGFILSNDGSFSFNPSLPVYDHLNVGDSEVLNIPVTITDDQGATDNLQIQISVTGTNDVLVAGTAVTMTVDEGSVIVEGQLNSSDLDDGSTATYSITGGASAPAGFSLDTDGSYSFDPADAAYDHLKVGVSEVITVPVTIMDDQGATDTTQIQITITGTNDAPIAGDDVTASLNVGDAAIAGLLTSSDVDDGASTSFAITGGSVSPAGFTLDSDGNYSFDPATTSYGYLDAGVSEVLTISIIVTDDQSATDIIQIQITVTGVNNIPVANDDSYITFGNTLLEVGVPSSGNIAVIVSGSLLDNDSDLDAGDVLTASVETAPVSGSVSINSQGNFSYVPSAGQTSITDSFTYRVSDGIGSAVATAYIDITDRIWYIDNLNSAGSGTSDDPFASLSSAELVVEFGDTIYIANGDGTNTGLDSGLTLSVSDVSIIGEGEALVINSTMLVAAGSAPSITSLTGSGITLNSAHNTLIKGVNIYGTLLDGLVINDSEGVEIEGITISQIGQSAIQGSGTNVELSLTDVIIESIDQDDSTVSDDAIFMAATSSISLTMNGGSISGVPGKLGDGIEFENTDTANAVTMNLDVRGVIFSDIQQDGIKLDNDNGNFNVQIGGSTMIEGNIFDVGFRGVHIKTSADPTLSRTNTISIQNNNITSANEGIQIRSIEDATNLSILDNTLTRALIANDSDLIDMQAELTANTQARINRNDISNVTGSDGIKVRVFDGATLTMEALNNAMDGPAEGFDFDVIETDLTATDDTTLNMSVLNNTLSTIDSQAMNARNANATSSTCLDLQGNSEVADYVVDAVVGSFALSANPQNFVLDPPEGSTVLGVCPVPTF